MKVNKIRLQNFRSFNESGFIELSQINILIGENNSGKSSILRGLHQLQNGLNDIYADVRIGSERAKVTIELENIDPNIWNGNISESTPVVYTSEIHSQDRRSGSIFNSLTYIDGRQIIQGQINLPNKEPNHFIIPFFSKRKASAYFEDVREDFVKEISSNMNYLAAKLSRLSNPSFPAYELYDKACKEILGFSVTNIPSLNGQRPGIYLPDMSTLPIDQMGEGVPNIVSLLANLSVSRDKLFLIEEPENDLHPNALKALLNLIISSSQNNQFVISTHSNIVVSHLCTNAKSKLFKISSRKDELPTTAIIEAIPPEADSRIRVLQELGYAFSDYDMWDGWLLLEESSAEKIIRDYLIPWFAPKLTRVKTISAGGVSNVEPAFTDLHRLMLFIHLQPAYAGKAWVRIDGDNAGKLTIENLRTKFPSIKPGNFSIFDKAQFEYYYPSIFSEKVAKILSIESKKDRREAKRNLLIEVIQWLDSDIEQAKKSLKISAASVICELQKIESEFIDKEGR